MDRSSISEYYIKFINENFDANKHIFIYDGGSSNKLIKISNKPNVIVNERIKNRYLKIVETFIILNKYSYKSDKIILHGLFNPRLILFLFLNPWLLKKCYWVIWGGDLYYYKEEKQLSEVILEIFRKSLIKRFGGLVTYIKGDYDLAIKWYRAKGTYYECIMYPSNLYKELEIKRLENQDKIYIQLGNSADPSNEHLEILERLEQYKSENIEIICPLSYGDKEYALKIKRIGEEKFGNKFVALTDFIPFEKYLEVLGEVDIAIFNHNRQQAMGNIISLLGLGKKVYIRNSITTWGFFKRKNILIYDVEEFELNIINEKIREKNIQKVKEYFSEINLKSQLMKIFIK